MRTKRATHLRAVPDAHRRPSVIIDLERGQHMTPPFTMAEVQAAYDTPGPIPHRVSCAMWVAAWARAEYCPLNIIAGRFEPHCRYTPSDELWAAVAQTAGDLAGALLFAIPIRLDQHKRAFAATWPIFWERN